MPLKSFTPAEMFLTERRRLELPLLAMIWLGVASISLAEGDYFYLLAGTLAVAANLLATMRAKEVYLARRLVNGAVVVATIIMLLELWPTPRQPLVPLRHFLILIQLCKLFERKTNRDYSQMVVLSILLMIAGAVTNQTMTFAVAMIVEMVIVCHVTMVLTIKRGLDRVATTQLTTETRPLSVQRLAWNVIRDWPGRALRWQLTGIMSGILATGVAVFLLAPRTNATGNSLFAETDTGSATTGMGGIVQLGEPRTIYQSSRVMMRIKVHSATAGASLAQGTFYLRGRAYDNYSMYAQSRWTRPPLPEQPRELSLPIPPPPAQRDAIAQEIQMSRDLLPTMFGCGAVIAVQPPALRSIDKNLNIDLDIPIRNEAACQYTVYSLLPAEQKKHQDFLSSQRLALGEKLSYPQADIYVAPSVRKLADEWCADLPRPSPGRPAPNGWELAVANRISSRLQERCSYTLDLSEADPSRDAIEDFLFYMRKGHCEYFASALTIMCHSQGVSSRLATGFLVNPQNIAGDTYVARGMDAHAWTEIRVGGLWTIVDPTPGNSRAMSHHAGWWARLGRWGQDFRFSWNKDVVGYNTQTQWQLGQWCLDLLGKCRDSIYAAGASMTKSVTNLLLACKINSLFLSVIGVLGAATLLAETVLVLRLIRRIRKNRRAVRDPLVRTEAQLQFIQRFFTALVRIGLKSQRSQTLRETANLAAEQFHLPHEALAELVDLHYRLRWGRQAPPPECIASAAARAKQLTAMLPR